MESIHSLLANSPAVLRQSAAPQAAAEEPDRKAAEPADTAPARPLRPDRDTYTPGTPETQSQSTGRYWPVRDEAGRPAVRRDLPAPARETTPDTPARPAAEEEPAAGEKPAEGEKPAKEENPAEEERCTVNTDRVDREIKRLKEQKAALARQLQRTQDPARQQQLGQRLEQVEAELQQKDNDAYRRQHAEYGDS